MVILTPFLAGRTSQSAWRTGKGQTRGSPASTTSSWPCSQSSSASPWKAGRPSSTGWVSFDNNFHFQSHPHPRNWCRCHCPDCLAESRLAPIWSPTIYHSNFKSFPRKSHTKYQIFGAPLKLNVEICQKICCFFLLPNFSPILKQSLSPKSVLLQVWVSCQQVERCLHQFKLFTFILQEKTEKLDKSKSTH